MEDPWDHQVYFLGVRRTRATRAVATRRRSGRKKTAAPARTTRSKRSTRTSVTVDSDEENNEIQEVSDEHFLYCMLYIGRWNMRFRLFILEFACLQCLDLCRTTQRGKTYSRVLIIRPLVTQHFTLSDIAIWHAVYSVVPLAHVYSFTHSYCCFVSALWTWQVKWERKLFFQFNKNIILKETRQGESTRKLHLKSIVQFS
jgi:hypothetical protein